MRSSCEAWILRVPIAATVSPLVNLAQSRAPDDRERLLAKLADLCEARARPLPPRPAAEAEAVMLALMGEAEHGVRARFAERIARATWPSAQLIEMLVRDDVDVARPLIAASPLLGEARLLALIEEGDLAHRVEVARRPLISEAVAGALVARDEAPILVALAGNGTARIDQASMRRLVERARASPALASALAAHPRIGACEAAQLHPLLGPREQAALADRFGFEAIAPAQPAAAGGAQTRAGPAEPEPSEIKLIEKLAAAGQLRPGYLLRVLKEGRLGLFAAGMAKLGGFPLADVMKAIDDPSRPELLALACAAVGLDRSVFPELLQMVRRCNDGRPGGGGDSARRAANAFGPFTPQMAASTFRIALGGV